MSAQSVMLGVVIWYAAVSVVSFVAYGWDKRAAGLGRRRVPEATLLTIDLLGGWPGGWIGRRTFHHKTRKGSYRARFYGVVALHGAGWGVVVWMVGGARGWWGG